MGRKKLSNSSFVRPGSHLDQPISWSAAPAFEDLALLNDLQGNILKGHGRKHVALFFLRFVGEDEERSGKARAFLGRLQPFVTTAFEQLQARSAQPRIARQDAPFVGVMLSQTGYKALGESSPRCPAFQKGMKRRGGELDENTAMWESRYRDGGPIDAVVVLATGDDPSDRSPIVPYENAYIGLIGKEAEVVALERGSVMVRGKRSIEPFGYADSFSQPLFLREDIEVWKRESSGQPRWDPAFPLSSVLLKDPSGDRFGFGSFFVFRKLEQDVTKFTLDNPNPGDGASLVGRSLNGTPLTLSAGRLEIDEPTNNFNYQGDAGERCPDNAHIRLANPRRGKRLQQFPRRGIPYRDPPEPFSPYDRGAQPVKSQGLLFMAYNRDIVRQFEAMQARLSHDPMMKYVTVRGGEYFYAPSISGLRRLSGLDGGR